MRELDESTGLPKGSAFRAFKAQVQALDEGRDYVVLDPRSEQGLAASAAIRERLYRSSVAAVLLAPSAAARVRAAMLAAGGVASR